MAPIPPQLKLGEVSTELRRLIWYAVYKDFRTCLRPGFDESYVGGRWAKLLRDMDVRIFKKMPDQFNSGGIGHEQTMKRMFEQAVLGRLFDFVEFLLGHPEGSATLRKDIADAFVEVRAAYRIDGESIIAVGTDEQAATFERAVNDAEQAFAVGARVHLINAGKALSRSDWSGSVRESIHAVESVAVQLAPDKSTLGSALGALESQGHLHGALKTTFTTLYGYTSNEEGVRHALVFNDEARVDEADALFMLGACASFVSYLIARGNSAGLASQGQ